MFTALLLAGSVFLLTLVNTNAAIVLLIFSMLLSPEISLAQLPDRAVVVRFDDLLLGVVFFTWLAKLAINKQLGVIRSTPLNVPLGLFILCCVGSTVWGSINGSVKNVTASFFYLLKYVEYFVLYFMVANVIRERAQAQLFLKAMLLTAAVVSFFAYWQMLTYGAGFRVTAPFEGAHAEPNTLAGYLIVMLGVCVGMALYSKSMASRLPWLALIALMLPPFIYTYSRGGYAGCIAMYVTFCLASKRHRLVLWTLLLLGVIMAPVVIPASVFQRIAGIFDPMGTLQIGGVGGVRLALSPAYRLLTWKFILQKWQGQPWFGFGVTGIGQFVDGQYVLVLGELGLVGMGVFLWIRWRLLRISYRALRTTNDPWVQGLSLGFMAGLVGLLIHSFSGNMFIIVRVMEPFWFLAALVTVLPQIIPAPPESSGPSGIAAQPSPRAAPV